MIYPNPRTGSMPKIHPDAFIAENATIIGDVEIKEGANIWFGAVLRADWGKIVIGKNTSVQEHCTMHIAANTDVIIGDNNVIGHGAMIHGPCVIGDNNLIGINSTVLEGSKIGNGCILAAGALLRSEMPDRTMFVGIPAVLKKQLTEEIEKSNIDQAKGYVYNGEMFKKAGLGQKIPKSE